MTRATLCESSTRQSELNALAPLRVEGLAQLILDHAEDPAKVREYAHELLSLGPDLLAMLVAQAEGLPELT